MNQETFYHQISAKLKSTDSELHKKTNVLLESIEMNLQKNQTQNDQTHRTTLLAALISLINQNQQKNEYNNMDAQLYLLSQLIPQVPVSIIRRIRENLSNTVQSILSFNLTHIHITKFSLIVLGQILFSTAVSDLQDQLSDSLFKAILWQVVSDKKPIRKQAIKITKQLCEQRTFDIFSEKNEIFKNALQNFFKLNLSELNESKLHSITLLVQVQTFLPYTLLGDALQIVIRQIPTADSDVLIHLFLALENILSDRSASSETIEKILTQIFQIQVDHEQQNACFAYIQCLRQCIVSMTQTSKINAGLYLPTVISTMIEFLLQENEKLYKFVTIEIIKVIKVAGSTVLEKNNSSNNDMLEVISMLEIENSNGSSGNIVQKYLTMMQYLLSNRFERVQEYVLDIIQAFFESVKVETFPIIIIFLKQFISYKDHYNKDQFMKCMGALANQINLTQLVDVYPINLQVCDPILPNFDDLSNCWIISVFNQRVQKNDLQQYYLVFQPLLIQSLQIYTQLTENQQRIYFSIIHQLFEILRKCKIIKETILQQVFLQSSTQIFDLFIKLMDNNLPFFQIMLKAAERILTQFAYEPLTQKLIKDRAQQMIAVLARFIVGGDEKCRPLLNLIKIFAHHSSQDYLVKAISKNMEKIIEISKNNDKIQIQNGMKNMDILLQVISAVKMQNDTWQNCVNFATQLLQEKNKFQKKGYKFLHEIIEKVHYSFLEEISVLLIENSQYVQPFSKQKRFQVLQVLLDKQFGTYENQQSRYTVYDFQNFIQNFLPEIVVSVQDSNLKTRIIVDQLLESVGKKLIEIEQLQRIMPMILAGLAGNSSLMKSDAIATISILLEKFYPELETSFIVELTQLIVLMLKEKNNEVYRAVLFYLMKLARAHKKHAITQLPGMSEILTELLQADQEAREKNIVVIKRLIISFVRAYGIQTVENSFPLDHKKLLRNIRRVEKRTKKNKQKQKVQYAEDVKKMAEKLDKTQKPKLKKKPPKHSDDEGSDYEQQKLPLLNGGMEEEAKNDNNNLLLKYDFKKEKFHFTEDFNFKRQQKKQEPGKNIDVINQDVEFKNGKVIVREEKEVTGQKRRRENRFEDNDSGNENETIKTKKVRGREKKEETVHIIKESGQIFQPKQQKTGGDVLIKGRPEPFAFIQLNPKVLNKRFRAKAQLAFDQVLGKKSAILKGLKAVKK